MRGNPQALQVGALLLRRSPRNVGQISVGVGSGRNQMPEGVEANMIKKTIRVTYD